MVVVVVVCCCWYALVHTGNDLFKSTGLEKMFFQTTPKTDSIIVIDGTNDEPDNTYFTPQMNPRSPNEAFKDVQTLEVIQETSKVFYDENSTVDSCISGSMKLLIKPKEPENGQGDLLTSSPTTEDTIAMTANNDLTASVDDVDMFTHERGISDKCSLNAYRIDILHFLVDLLSCSCNNSVIYYALEKFTYMFFKFSGH